MQTSNVKELTLPALPRVPGTLVVSFSSPYQRAHSRFGPALEEAALDHPDVTFVNVDVNNHQELAEELGVDRTPALIVFRSGIKVAERRGEQPKPSLDRILELHS